jgi:hypothetical protein
VLSDSGISYQFIRNHLIDLSLWLRRKKGTLWAPLLLQETLIERQTKPGCMVYNRSRHVAAG